MGGRGQKVTGSKKLETTLSSPTVHVVSWHAGFLFEEGGLLGRRREKQRPGLRTKNELPFTRNTPANLPLDPNYTVGSVEGAEKPSALLIFLPENTLPAPGKELKIQDKVEEITSSLSWHWEWQIQHIEPFTTLKQYRACTTNNFRVIYQML